MRVTSSRMQTATYVSQVLCNKDWAQYSEAMGIHGSKMRGTAMLVLVLSHTRTTGSNFS